MYRYFINWKWHVISELKSGNLNSKLINQTTQKAERIALIQT